MKAQHPTEDDLALLASDDGGPISRFLLRRHVKNCPDCAETVLEYEALREELSQLPMPDLDWDSLALEMKANVRLGLEAGECVRTPEPRMRWNPRLAVAFASLSFLLCAGLLMKSPDILPSPQLARSAVPTLESTGAGVEFRDGANSITLTNHHGSMSDSTVNARGEIRARYVEAGTVTITNVSLE